MEVTEEMLIAAMKKAVDVGIFTGVADIDAYVSSWASMKQVLQAALDTVDQP